MAPKKPEDLREQEEQKRRETHGRGIKQYAAERENGSFVGVSVTEPTRRGIPVFDSQQERETWERTGVVKGGTTQQSAIGYGPKKRPAPRDVRFDMRMTSEEWDVLEALAIKEERTMADVVRRLVRAEARRIEQQTCPSVDLLPQPRPKTGRLQSNYRRSMKSPLWAAAGATAGFRSSRRAV